MKKSAKKITAALLTAGAILCGTNAFAGETGTNASTEFKIKTRTSFGVDLDSPYNMGLYNELLDMAYVVHMGPGGGSNKMSSAKGPVGFITFSVYDFGIQLQQDKGTLNKAIESTFTLGNLRSGINWGPWTMGFYGSNTENFLCTWNKSLEFVDYKIQSNWASMGTSVGLRRKAYVSSVDPLDSDTRDYGVGKYYSYEYPLVEQANDGQGLDFLDFTIPSSAGFVNLMYNRPDSFGVDLKLASENAFTAGANSVHDYNGVAGAVDFFFTPAFAQGLRLLGTVAGTWNYGADHNADALGAAAKVGYTYYFNEDMSIEPYVGFDSKLSLEDDWSLNGNGWELSTGATVRWPGSYGWLTDYITADEGRVFPGMSLAYAVYQANSTANLEQNLKFTLFEPRGDDGAFYVLGSEMIVDVNKIGTKDWELLATLYFDAEFSTKKMGLGFRGTLIPWTTIYYDNVANGDERENALKTDFGVKLRDAVPNTVLGLTWLSGNLIPSGSTKARLGYVRLSAEITF